MNSRLKSLLPASLAAAALACGACGGGARELQTADTAALVSAPAQLLAPAAPAAEAERRAFAPVVAPGDGIELAEESIDEKSEKLKYEIDVTFPRLKGRLSPQAEKFNRAVRAFVEGEVRGLKRANARPAGRRAKPEPFADFYESLSGGYEFIHFADDLISVRLTLYAYGRGAAHPIQFHHVINFDLRSGRALELGDIFEPGARHLQALAAYCTNDLKRQDEEGHRRAVADAASRSRPPGAAGSLAPDSWFQSGAGPEADNYRAWNLAAEGVVVAFASCQVLSCADGEKEVLVPYPALDTVLDQSSPAARLFARQPR